MSFVMVPVHRYCRSCHKMYYGATKTCETCKAKKRKPAAEHKLRLVKRKFRKELP